MHGLSQLTVVRRFSNLPVVKTSIDKATDIYVRVKKSNKLIEWSLQTAEATVTIAVDIGTLPVVLLDRPIHLLDEILCMSLDMVEDAVPIIKQPPNEIYLEAKKVVTSVMQPVLKRADSVKEISISYSNRAAESIDNVLTTADGIVDKYLPEMGDKDQKHGTIVAVCTPPRNPTEKTIRHLSRTSRTLTRRLTQRTIFEARALKDEGVNTIYVLVKMTDLLIKDPKNFAQRMKQLWSYLSEDEPQNQVPPKSVDALIVLLTREGARTFVHIANFVTHNTVKIPQNAHTFMNYTLLKYSEYVDSLHLESSGVRRQAEILRHAIQDMFEEFLKLVKPVLPGYSDSEGKVSNTSTQNAIEDKESDDSKKSQSNKGKPKKPNTNKSQANGAVTQTVN